MLQLADRNPIMKWRPGSSLNIVEIKKSNKEAMKYPVNIAIH
jgi:hypothetical protein